MNNPQMNISLCEKCFSILGKSVFSITLHKRHYLNTSYLPLTIYGKALKDINLLFMYTVISYPFCALDRKGNGGLKMPFSTVTKEEIYDYCNKHLPSEKWYKEQFEFIEDGTLRKRIIEEFKSTRFAYKFYEGIGATDENFIFEVRHQIFSYASIYEAIIHYVLYNYYNDTEELQEIRYHTVPTRKSYSQRQMMEVRKILNSRDKEIYIYHMQKRKKEDTQVRFDDKCRTAVALGLIKSFKNNQGKEIDLPSEIIKIYEYRNAIHLIAERRKAIDYELKLSKKAYRRMKPFLKQIKDRLKKDQKSIYVATQL